MENFSQNQEQAAILAYFGKEVQGTFLDLGANDGITLSNTRALALMGWKGVLVDASPKAFARLRETYKDHDGISCFEGALASYDGNIKLQDSGALISNKDVALVSTVNQWDYDRFKSAVSFEEIEVPCFTWKTFLKASPIKEFTMMSIDIEGSELDVLPHMDLSRTLLVCIEWNGKEEAKREFDKYLKGFHIIYTSGENLIYVR